MEGPVRTGVEVVGPSEERPAAQEYEVGEQEACQDFLELDEPLKLHFFDACNPSGQYTVEGDEDAANDHGAHQVRKEIRIPWPFRGEIHVLEHGSYLNQGNNFHLLAHGPRKRGWEVVD